MSTQRNFRRRLAKAGLTVAAIVPAQALNADGSWRVRVRFKLDQDPDPLIAAAKGARTIQTVGRELGLEFNNHGGRLVKRDDPLLPPEPD